jgi:hypothetical protein
VTKTETLLPLDPIVFTPTTFRHTKRLPIRVSRPSHKKFHFNNNLLFSLTPLVLYSFSPLPYSFIHLPAVFAQYFSPLPSLSLSHFAACVRSSHCPRVTSPALSLSLLLPSHSCFLSPRPHLCNPLSFSSLTHTFSPPYCTSIL